jgi:hypothetical protein
MSLSVKSVVMVNTVMPYFFPEHERRAPPTDLARIAGSGSLGYFKNWLRLLPG